MYQVIYLDEHRALHVVTTPSCREAVSLYLNLDRRSVRNVKVWRAGSVVVR
jgi:hypothetical protein